MIGTVGRLAACVLLAASPAARAAPALLPTLGHGANYAESYTIIADLADGSYVHLTFSFTNLGPGSTKGICRVLVASAGRAPWKASTRVGRKEWNYQSSPNERLGIGTCEITADRSSTRVRAVLDDGDIRLTIAAPLKAQVPPNALVTVGADPYRTEILLYRAPVEAVLTLPGDKPRTLAGSAYADHSRSSVPPKGLAARWIRFRALRGERGLLVLGRESHENEFKPLWSCESPGRWRQYASFRVERSGDPAVPTFAIHLQGSEGGLELHSKSLVFRDAPVEELGVIGKVVAPFVGSPVTYVYRGSATENGGPPIEGILEVELAEE